MYWLPAGQAPAIAGPSGYCRDTFTDHLLHLFQEFVVLSQSLMNDPIMEKEMITRAKDYVKKHHSWEGERKTYQNLVLRLQ